MLDFELEDSLMSSTAPNGLQALGAMSGPLEPGYLRALARARKPGMRQVQRCNEYSTVDANSICMIAWEVSRPATDNTWLLAWTLE
jgi:hypothetical protein